MSKPKLLIVNPQQFGYGAGYYYYVRYLKDYYDITFICFDKGYNLIQEQDINVIYLPFFKNRISRNYNFLKTILGTCRNNYFNIIFTKWFNLALLIPLFVKGGKKILDIRSVSVYDSKIKRIFENKLKFFSSLPFNKVTVVSKSSSKLLHLPRKKANILPLGADILDDRKKDYNKMHLLYVGVITNRNLLITIKGVKKFIEKNKNCKSFKYYIIGYGTKEDENEIFESIEENKLNGIVIYLGRKNHKQLSFYLRNSTIGICFVPQTDYYNVQPSTKIFEYVLSGLITIATDTYENRKLINEVNGVICQDNVESFTNALEKIYNNLDSYKEESLRASLEENRWDKIVDNYLIPIFKK